MRGLDWVKSPSAWRQALLAWYRAWVSALVLISVCGSDEDADRGPAAQIWADVKRRDSDVYTARRSQDPES